MTRNPICCLPEDKVRDVAKLMEAKDLGPIPVVESHRSRRICGIVTDRDLTLKVLAEGRDPKSTRVKDVMTRNPVTCKESDNIEDCLALMEKHQVRRIPIVDSQNCTAGIIAQADIATRLKHPDKTAELVEQVSRDDGVGSFEIPTGGMSTGQSLAILGGVGLGLGLMYLLDPNNGRERRSAVGKAAREIGDRVLNASQGLRSRFRSEGEGAAWESAEQGTHEVERQEWLTPTARLLAGATGGALAIYGVRRLMTARQSSEKEAEYLY